MIPDYYTTSLYDYPAFRQLPSGDLCVTSQADTPDPGFPDRPKFKLGWKRPGPGGWDAAIYPVLEMTPGVIDKH
jgi:hypothetical protein